MSELALIALIAYGFNELGELDGLDHILAGLLQVLGRHHGLLQAARTGL